MTNESNDIGVWSSRLKGAREATGMSQRALGIAAGLDPSVASTRVNRYEVGVHAPAYSISCRLAEVLEVPVAYLYCDDDELAEFILGFHRSGSKVRREVKKLLGPAG